MKTWQSIVFGTFIGLLASGAILLIAKSPTGEPIKLLPPPTQEPIFVYIVGEINSPGIYSLPINSRIVDAVLMANNFTSNANKEAINLAEKIHDGDLIFVPAIEELSNKTTNTQTISVDNTLQRTTSPEILININTANQQDLEMLPDIGEAIAIQIINYRSDNGPFVRIEDIQMVPGIGPSIYEQIKPLITINE